MPTSVASSKCLGLGKKEDVGEVFEILYFNSYYIDLPRLITCLACIKLKVLAMTITVQTIESTVIIVVNGGSRGVFHSTKKLAML